MKNFAKSNLLFHLTCFQQKPRRNQIKSCIQYSCFYHFPFIIKKYILPYRNFPYHQKVPFTIQQIFATFKYCFVVRFQRQLETWNEWYNSLFEFDYFDNFTWIKISISRYIGQCGAGDRLALVCVNFVTLAGTEPTIGIHWTSSLQELHNVITFTDNSITNGGGG